MSKTQTLSVVTLVLCLLTLAPVAAGPAHFTTIDYPGAVYTLADGINPAGDITGNYADPTTGAFRYSYVISNGVTSWFTVPGSTITRSWDISATGEVVGWYKDSSAHFHGFPLRRGELTSIDVDLPGVTATRAFGVTAPGGIVGYYNDATGIHGFLLTKRGGE